MNVIADPFKKVVVEWVPIAKQQGSPTCVIFVGWPESNFVPQGLKFTATQKHAHKLLTTLCAK